MTAEPQSTTSYFVDLLDHWQSLVGALIGFLAAIVAVVMTLRAERRRAEREAVNARASIGTEVRQMTQRVAEGFEQVLLWLESGTDVSLDSIILEIQLPLPLVFPQVTGQLNVLGPVAISAVQLYGAPDMVQKLFARLGPYGADPAVRNRILWDVAAGFTQISRVAMELIPALPPADPRDAKVIEHLQASIAKATTLFQRCPYPVPPWLAAQPAP